MAAHREAARRPGTEHGVQADSSVASLQRSTDEFWRHLGSALETATGPAAATTREDPVTQYLLSMPHDSAEEPTMATMDPAALAAALAAAGAFMEELSASGALVFAGGLHPPSTAVTVDHIGEDLDLTDGPYTEAPEYLGGMWVIEAPDRDAAVTWAAKASKALGARIEVRAFQEVPA